ncbi:hypothetical protein [Cyanothece sp. BG0011]|uniref:hypothetical protein n=1 Tax=Cyanothece sp. BG0011 TaxID=2082950 RepID=UPI000D1DBFDD|nr:hypothetical protein [Cyanothece sp. BG0011]
MTSVNGSIPFETLVETIKSLDLRQQQELLEILEEQMFEAEEDWENSEEIIAEVEEAKKAYQAGDYLTLEDFISSQS